MNPRSITHATIAAAYTALLVEVDLMRPSTCMSEPRRLGRNQRGPAVGVDREMSGGAVSTQRRPLQRAAD